MPLDFRADWNEWVRRCGASLPMRMTASYGSGLRTYRIQGCGAIDRARKRAPPRDRHPDRMQACSRARIPPGERSTSP